MSFVVALILMVGFFGIALFVFRRFDAMVHHIYVTDKVRWQELGSPMGYFWIPRERTPFFRSTCSRDALLVRFIFAGLKEPNQPPQRNAGSRPPSDDSSVSETPSSRGPRG